MLLRLTLVLVAALVPPLPAQDPMALAEHETLGQGTPGSAGVPHLGLVGRAAIGEPGPGLRIEGGAPGARALLVIGPGVGNLPLPAFGATLFAQLPASRFDVGPLDAAGHSELFGPGPAPLAPALAGLDFVAQGLVLDAAAQGGAAFTAGMRLRCGAGFAAAGLFAGLGYRLHPTAIDLDPVLAAGDFDGNGRPDLVCVLHETSVGKLRLLRQLDDGSFAPAVPYPLPSGTVYDLLPADLDGDDHLDLIVSSHLGLVDNKLRLLHGLGDGRFGGESFIDPPPAAPCSLALGELTGDGVEDLAVSEWGPGNLVILPGITGAPQHLNAAGTTAPGTLRAADLDGDGLTDLALLINEPIKAFVVHRGLAGGDFAPFQGTPIGTHTALSLALGDLDGDGDLDAVAGVRRPTFVPTPTLYVLRNDGAAGFTTSVSPPPEHFTGSDVNDVELADLDGDDDLDLVVGHHAETFAIAPAFVLENQGGGAFGPGQKLLALASRGVVTDFDGDGRADLAGVSQGSFEPPVVAVWRGLGNGGFDLPPVVPGMEVGSARAADLDGDGDLDLLGDANDPQGLVPAVVAVSLWSDAGGFGTPAYHDAGGGVSKYDGLDVGNVDDDPALDVVVAGGGSVRVLHGDGAGGLQPSFEWPVALARSPRIADADGDGRADLIVSAGSSGLQVLLGQPGGGFLAPVVTPTSPPGTVFRYALGELDGDGLLDAVVQGSNGFHVFRGTGGGHFASSFTPDPNSSSAYEQPLVLADLDGDGDLDLARADLDFQLAMWRNDGSGVFTKGQTQASGTWYRLAAADVNGDGALDLLGSELALGFGDGSFAPALPNFLAGAIGDFDGDGDVDSFAVSYLFFNRSF